MSSRPCVLLGTAAAGALLLLAAPAPTLAWTELRQTGEATDPTAPLVGAVALAAWVLTGWLIVTGVLIALGRRPGLTGRLTSVAAARVAPAAVRRAVEVALGLTVTVGVLGASPALAGIPHPPADAVRSLDWSGGGSGRAPDLDWPAPAAPTSTEPPASTIGGVAPGASAPPRAAALPSQDGLVVVRPGDSLWSLAEQELQARGADDPTPAQVASRWPTWWAANRELVGDDPDLLRPGTALAPPTVPFG